MKNMKIKTIIFTVALLVMGYETQAQQLPESNLYSFNKYTINPAYAGFNDCLEIYGSHLSQWVGIDGAPNTNYFSAHAGIGDNMGLGGGIILDKAAFISKFSAKLTYAYRIKLGEDHNLRFGLSAGLFQVTVDATSAIVDDITDEVVSGGAQSGMNFNSDFGVFYNIKGFQLGLSIPQIFETEAKLNYQTIDGFTERRHFVAYTGYDWAVNEKWNVEPSVLYKTAQSGLNQFDINGLVTYNKLLSVGFGYRTHVGVIARLGLNIKELLYLGYAYEFSGANISSYSQGSHEIMLGIKFCKEPKNKSKGSFGESIDAKGFTEVKVKDVEEEAEVIVEELVDEEPAKVVDLIVEPLEALKVIEEVEEIEEVVDQNVVEENVPELKVSNEEQVKEVVKKLDINFQLNKTNGQLSSNDELDKLAKLMKEDPTVNIKVIGHACDIGTDEANKLISEQRAKQVLEYLLNKGVSKGQIKIDYKGSSQPKYSNDTESNRAKNRRVEVELN
ncbi:MAG: type IX secretion system PorP/SprF family membrane protein [Parvicella sp.]|jgi:type IX secretion system PorP/SprF family membrane protein